jgi:hypothetical protein
MSRNVHILWSPQTGPICAYEDGILAHAHARTMLGVMVATIELRTDLPEIARNDLAADFDSQFEDETPVDEIPFNALEDAARTDEPDTSIVDPEEGEGEDK